MDLQTELNFAANKAIWNDITDALKITCKGKVKGTLVQALRLCTGRTADRGSRGIALPFLNHGTRRG
jgi:hypothetical protein